MMPGVVRSETISVLERIAPEPNQTLARLASDFFSASSRRLAGPRRICAIGHNFNFQPVECLVDVNGVGPIFLAMATAQALIPAAPKQCDSVALCVIGH